MPQSRLKADLDVAYMFASIALQTNDRNKMIRNRENARKGYETIVHFLSAAKLTGKTLTKLTTRLRG
ncbi:MAG: hypothetical protein ACRD40_19420 [Candidatus Acidiferrales bacterium]